jgi:hypothetical protein
MATGACGVTKPDGEPSCISSCSPDGVYPGPCVEEYDSRRDGTINKRLIWHYDKWCEPARLEEDEDADGTPDGVTVWERDELGLLVRESVGSVGSVAGVTSYTYDEAGYLVLREYDSGADGTIDSWTEYVNDETGNIRDEKTYSEDGTVKYWTVQGYDGMGRLVLVEDHYYPCGDMEYVFTGDVVAVRETFAYDANGNLVLQEVDREYCDIADGIVDERTEWTYDPDGRLLAENVDLAYDDDPPDPGGPDGVFEVCTTYHYDDRGFLVRTEVENPIRRYTECEGIPDNVIHYIRDDEGRVLSQMTDELADGVIDAYETFRYDSCGNQIEMLSDKISVYDGSWRYYRWTWRYGCWH